MSKSKLKFYGAVFTFYEGNNEYQVICALESDANWRWYIRMNKELLTPVGMIETRSEQFQNQSRAKEMILLYIRGDFPTK